MFIWLKISLPEHPPDSLLAFLHEKPSSLIETLFFPSVLAKCGVEGSRKEPVARL